MWVFKRVAVQNEAGMVAIQDPVDQRVYWVDATEEIMRKTTHTLLIRERTKWNLVYSIYSMQRSVMDSRPTLPYRVRGQVFWEMRCIYKCIDIDYG